MPKTTITAQTIVKAKADAVPGGTRHDIVDARATGLSLRVSPTGVQWSFRYRLNNKDHRLALGSVDQWSIAEARSLAGKAHDMLRDRMGIPDEAWLDRQRVQAGKIAAATLVDQQPEQPREAFKLTFSAARTAYLAEVERTLSKKSWADYTQKLSLPELAVLEREPLPTITRQRVAGIIAAIHRTGREATAEGAARVISTLWTWCAADAQVERTGVASGVMLGIKAPARTRKKSKRMVADPTLEDLGRIVAICRMHEVVYPSIAAAMELVIWTAQRRQAVAAAKIEDFRALPDGERGLWYVFADDRKRSDGEAHVIPLPAPAWSCVQRAIAFAEHDHKKKYGLETNGPEFLFPQQRARRRGDMLTHINPSTITHNFDYLPGTHTTPHGVRTIFGTYGERILGFSRVSTKTILDHSEGGQRSDVTGKHYALHDGTHEKWPIMEKWCAAVESDFVRVLPMMEPVREIRAAVADAIYRAKNKDKGDDGLRIAAE